jgi:hypothetical protein
LKNEGFDEPKPAPIVSMAPAAAVAAATPAAATEKSAGPRVIIPLVSSVLDKIFVVRCFKWFDCDMCNA